MNDLDMNSKNRTELFNKIGPDIAQKMSIALQNLTGKDMKVEFKSVQTFEQNKVSIEVEEKIFGSYVHFKSSDSAIQGISLAIFPISSTKNLTELLLSRFDGKVDIDARMKLSAFKEGVNILLMTYITGLANAFKIKLRNDVPKLAHFHNMEFVKSDLLQNYSDSDSLISFGQFSIGTCGADNGRWRARKLASPSPLNSIKGRFVIIF